ncbi:MAG: Hsp33 family molecular chaperone HslO [Lachnospiraceae bacterium]|nr:Hsp33 family molecular chaperone HslO [Lachnospiraceae bacterium]
MSDVILRAVAGNAEVRIFVADTKELVQESFEKHHTSPVATAALGRLLTAGAMMGAMQKGEKDLLTLKIKGDGPIGSITVTADALSRVKGYVGNPSVDIPLKKNGKLDVSGAIGIGDLTVIKDLGLKEPYIGRTELQTGEIAEDLTYYFTLSEQTPSSVGLGVLVDRDYSVRQAGGFIIQLMPAATEDTISRLEKNLSGITSVTSLLDSGKTPEDILAMITDGMDFEITDHIEPSYYCNCSKERVQKALVSLGKEELTSMIEEGKTIEVHCDFCNRYYYFTVEELGTLMEEADC